MSKSAEQTNDQSGFPELEPEVEPIEGTAVHVVQGGRDPLILRKAPEAIFLKPVSGEFTPLMHKSYNAILARAAKQGIDVSRYSVPLKEIVRDANFTSRDMAFFRECLKKLNGFQVEWDSFGTNGKRKGWGVSTLLAEAEIVEDTLFFSFTEKIKQQLLIPAIYQSINLALVAKFRSRAAMALYEACLRYATSPDGLTLKRPWQEWRGMLCGPNVKVDEWRYFRRDTLEPALAEVARLADDIEVEPIIYKDGRKVTDLQFRVAQKQQKALDLGDDSNIFNHALYDKLLKIGFKEKDATDYLLKHDEGRIKAVISFVEDKMRRGKAENPVGLFKDALKRGYGTAPEPEAPGLDHKKPHKELPDPKALLRQKHREQALTDYEALPEEARMVLWGQFLTEKPAHRVLAIKSGLKSKTVQVAFGDWMLSKHTPSPAPDAGDDYHPA